MKTRIESKIEETFGTIVCKFPILHCGWECDGEGFIVEKKEKRYAVLTNHSNPYICSVEELHKKIVEYKEAIQTTNRAILLLK